MAVGSLLTRGVGDAPTMDALVGDEANASEVTGPTTPATTGDTRDKADGVNGDAETANNTPPAKPLVQITARDIERDIHEALERLRREGRGGTPS